MNLLNILIGTTLVLALVSAAFAFIYDEWFGTGALFLVVVAHQIYLVGKRRRDALKEAAAATWRKEL